MNALAAHSQFEASRSLIDRRQRRRMSLAGFAARADGATAEILLLDLSYDGCGIQIPVELRRGETIKLSVGGRGAIPAEVRWCSGGKAGLIFKHDAPAAKTHKPRKCDRIAIKAEVTTRRLGRTKYRVRVRDLSCHGCKIELVERPQVGEYMFIKFTGIEALASEVCWVDTRCAGVRFENPIHPGVFDLLLERMVS